METEMDAITRLTEQDDRPIWEIRGYKTQNEVESDEEWENLITEAGEDIETGRFLGRMLTWQVDKPATDVARVVALRRKLARELKADSLIESMLVDLMVGNFQMQLDWWELLGSRTEILHRSYPRNGARGMSVESYQYEELADKVVPILDRLNRQFIRTVKAFRDLKTSPIVVNIGQAGQVNVGSEQVNVTTS